VSSFSPEEPEKVPQKVTPKVICPREYPERPVLGVGGVVISQGLALLVRRANPPLQGEWSIPGGMLEVGETVVEGVRRELAEETGIEVSVHSVIEVFERISLDAAGKAAYHYVVLDYHCEVVRGEARPGSDVTEVAWVPEANLEEYSLTPSAAQVVRKAFQIARER
jgi:8-oxo-dGTP diphosphatase